MHLRFEHVVAAPLETVFAFHEDPANLSLLAANMPSFRLLRHGGGIRPGSETWVEQRVAGCVRFVMGFRHIIYEPPRRFGEEMIRGPFRRFLHVHEFEPTPEGTVVRDLLEITLPWYAGGALATRLFVAPMIRRSFAMRQRTLEELMRQRTESQPR